MVSNPLLILITLRRIFHDSMFEFGYWREAFQSFTYFVSNLKAPMSPKKRFFFNTDGPIWMASDHIEIFSMNGHEFNIKMALIRIICHTSPLDTTANK